MYIYYANIKLITSTRIENHIQEDFTLEPSNRSIGLNLKRSKTGTSSKEDEDEDEEEDEVDNECRNW